MRRLALGSCVLTAVAWAAAAPAETVRIDAGRDATLIEDPDGALANGSGPYAFFGRIADDVSSIRRALLYFDVAAALPRDALIESVTLELYVETRNPRETETRLHRVLADWGEGPSSSSGGGGAPAEPGDATWLHTFWDDAFWTHAGAQFVGRPSARRTVGGSGLYVWASMPHMLQDVRLWRSNPRANHGWVLIGDETTRQTAKSLVSRENPEVALRPVLEITYRRPGERPPAPRPTGRAR